MVEKHAALKRHEFAIQVAARLSADGFIVGNLIFKVVLDQDQFGRLWMRFGDPDSPETLQEVRNLIQRENRQLRTKPCVDLVNLLNLHARTEAANADGH